MTITLNVWVFWLLIALISLKIVRYSFDVYHTYLNMRIKQLNIKLALKVKGDKA